ncbi:MAG: type II secretion system ATPase GspE [Chlamydiales bacterium]
MKQEMDWQESEKWAERFGVQSATSLDQFPFVQERRSLLPYAFVKRKYLLPISEKEECVLVATADPHDLEALEEVRVLLGRPIEELVAPRSAIEEAIERCYHQKEEETSKLIASFTGESGHMESEETEGYDLLEQRGDSPVIRMLNAMILEAVGQGASDIHFEPLETGLGVRYRIDGVLQMRHAPAKEYQAQLITRIKVMARLDIAEQRLPQDGRIKLRMGGRQIDFRVSTVPVVFGERIVLRILDKSNVILGLGNLGMREETLLSFKKMIALSEGVVLVTGPTGSGKTTTLYSALSELNSQEVNIMTIEDPVEYKLQGMAQIGVNPKISLTFATGLRHILRQDPDVIMIGEIRDKETAEIAIQASLTGHLVLSTLHTNDAPSALTRLVDMEIEPYLLSSSVAAVVAQRLVRMVCPTCATSYLPSAAEVTELGLSGEQAPFFKGKGCSSCYGSGYKGRCGIYELMVVNTAIKRQLLHSADAEELRRIAVSQGMVSLRSEGARLVQKGVTTTAEVLRVTRGCEEI